MESPSDGALQDHSQWFSPLGSSASRFTQDPPTSAGSALPAIFAGVPILGSPALGRATPSTGQEGSHRVAAASAPPGPVYQSWSSSHKQHDAEAASASGSEFSSQARIGGAPLGSWVAFDDSAQSALPMVPSHSQTAWNANSDHLQQSAQTAHKAAATQPIALTADITAAPLGRVSDQSRYTDPDAPQVSSGSSSVQAVASPASAPFQDSPTAMPLAQTREVGGAPPKSVRPIQDADADLLQWGGAHSLGQSASAAPAGAALDRGLPGSMPGCAGMSGMPASMQLPAGASCRAVPVRVIGPSCRDTRSAGASSSTAQQSQSLASGMEQASTGPLAGSSSAHHELLSLEREVKLKDVHIMLRNLCFRFKTLLTRHPGYSRVVIKHTSSA